MAKAKKQEEAIADGAVLENLQARCLQQLKDGNCRLATKEEQRMIGKRFAGINEVWATSETMPHVLGRYPLFCNLMAWLDDRLGFARDEPDLIAGITDDILNKEEFHGRT